MRKSAALFALFLLLALRAATAGQLSFASLPNPAVFGRPVTLTASSTNGTSIGRVAFYDGAAILGTAQMVNGRAAITTTLLSPGVHSLFAGYSGGSNTASRSAIVTETVTEVSGGGLQSAVNLGVGTGAWSTVVGDFNGDGNSDLAITYVGSSVVSVLLGNGDGTFQDPVSYTGVDDPREIAIGDFNGDGRVDLAVANYGSNSITIFLGDGQGGFQPLARFGVGVNPHSLAVADFNGDGIADIVTANAGGAGVSVLLGNGDATFGAPVAYATGNDPLAVAVADLNGDGSADLIVANYGGNNVSILLGKGDGTFGQPANQASGLGPLSLAVGDFNADGFPDLAVANLTDNNISLLLGNGDGTFQSAHVYQSGNRPYAIAAVDFNGDGQLDLVTADNAGNTVSLMLGTTDGFAPPISYAADMRPTGIALGDFNNDGRVDVVAANSGSGDISVLLGAIPAPALTVTVTDNGAVAQGRTAGEFTIMISNTGFTPTTGIVTVTLQAVPGLTVTSLSGDGWNCNTGTLTCTRADALPPSEAYSSITEAVTVGSNAPGGIVNTATVSGGGEGNVSNNLSSDYTTTFNTDQIAAAWSFLGLPAPFTAPGISAGAPILLTDGSVMLHQACSTNWYRLTPGLSGNYFDGAWSQSILPGGYSPLYFASAVLPDGRLVAIGGEYNGSACSPQETALGAIYDPASNLWSPLAAPAGWSSVGDASSVVLPNGHFLLAQNGTTRVAELDPATLAWAELNSANKSDSNSEEGWTLLPDGSVLTVDVSNAGQSERYYPATDSWISAGDTGPILTAGFEIGPQILRPDGTVFVAGATGHTAVYNVAVNKWAPGPDFPLFGDAPLASADSPAVLLPSGNVLVGASPFAPLTRNQWTPPAFFFEFDGTNLQAAPNPIGLGPNDVSFASNLLLLPNGRVLYAGNQSLQIYKPGGTPSSAWAPTISGAPNTVQAGKTYEISGRLFNGMSQAVAYGDDYQAATNYPLVRIVNNATGHFFFCKTHHHSTMAVATSSETVSTQFDIPLPIEPGPAFLQVVANGIASEPHDITVNAGQAGGPVIQTVEGGALSVPAVGAISSNGYFTVFGSGFIPTGGAQQVTSAQITDGSLPTNLGSTCVDVGSARAFLSYVSDTQINAIAPAVSNLTSIPVSVVTGCGSGSELSSPVWYVPAMAASPEFLYWQQNSNGSNPVMAVDAKTGAYIGPLGSVAGLTLTPARPGEVLTVYGIGFGPTKSGDEPGTIADSIDPLQSVSGVMVGPAKSIPEYAGLTLGSAGLYQVNFTVPSLSAGDYPIVITVNGAITPANAFLAIGQ